MTRLELGLSMPGKADPPSLLGRWAVLENRSVASGMVVESIWEMAWWADDNTGWEGKPADRSSLWVPSLGPWPSLMMLLLAFMAAVAGLGIEAGTTATVVGEGWWDDVSTMRGLGTLMRGLGTLKGFVASAAASHGSLSCWETRAVVSRAFRSSCWCCCDRRAWWKVVSSELVAGPDADIDIDATAGGAGRQRFSAGCPMVLAQVVSPMEARLVDEDEADVEGVTSRPLSLSLRFLS